MGRHKKSIERPCMPDVKYNSKVITKFVSRMMLDGKKATCTKIVYEALDKLKTKIESTTSAKNSKLYKEILNVLQSKQYLAQKRVVLNEKLFEKCIDFWPEMFDGIECKVDNDGNGIPDEDENSVDYF